MLFKSNSLRKTNKIPYICHVSNKKHYFNIKSHMHVLDKDGSIRIRAEHGTGRIRIQNSSSDQGEKVWDWDTERTRRERRTSMRLGLEMLYELKILFEIGNTSVHLLNRKHCL